jgi:benzoate-CoA ligase family protein
MAELWNASEWLVDRHVLAGRGGATALLTPEAELTYADVQRLVAGAATGLRAAGVGVDDRVALVLLDTPALVATFLAALRIGAIPVLVNPLLPARDAAAIAEDAQAALVFVSEVRPGHGDQLRDALYPTPVVVMTDEAWAGLVADVGNGEPAATTRDSAGFWLCTSGSTGKPKLAMHPQGHLQVVVDTYATQVLGVTGSDRCYSVGPMFHAYGLGNSLTFPLAAGATTVLEATRPPTPARVAEVVSARQPTLFFAIPTFYAALNASDIPDDTFASVRHGVSAAEALPAETWHRFRDRFGVEILDGIGSTELAHIFISNRPGAVRPGASGWPVPGYEARIVDHDDVDYGPDEAGLLLVRGPSAASGYWHQPEASTTAFGSAAGWVRTGDMYQHDAEGCFTYLGRADDMLRVGGEWVSPAEVEGVLVEQPDVLEVAVIGIDGDLGTRVVAYVVPKAGHNLDVDVLVAHCRERLAGYKRPKDYVVVDGLPKTATGKIQRFKLREQR